ncbi:hypothetical protein [Sporosarcina trichiuri]|uniref:hypothetical protein n=1 Tax=Sporosarcina trichiuri TaxID=3056445 RepID=UPI0025B425C0|nr:hypothetical protein [Sporosarcina sp. 0.2-SM1T-5]WJY27462.1 hypothetical protein QWT68_00120 [Sporosarcina sp. 0.2-SM1T-5]
MLPYKHYKDLLHEIELLEILIKQAEAERMEWDFEGRLGSRVRMDIAAQKLDRLAERIEELSEELDQREEHRKHIEHKLGEFQSIEYRVAYKRFVENKRLEVIAEEMGYSLAWIKKVSARI